MLKQCTRCGHQGVEVAIAKYSDKPLFVICTWCDHRWHLHPSGTALFQIAELFVNPDRRNYRRTSGLY